MITYLDSSVLLRVVLRQSNALAQWKQIEVGISSALTEVECLRTLDRLRLGRAVSDEELAKRRESVYRLLEAMEIVDLNRAVLNRASQPIPVELGTLDALHLATAALWREENSPNLVMATHDAALGLAARSLGFEVIGFKASS